MVPIHPIVVHFPIALLFVAAILHILSFFISKPDMRTFAFWMHIAGTVACIAAILTGDYAQGQVVLEPGQVTDLVNEHETWGMISGWGFGVLAVWAYLRKESQILWERVGFTILFVLMTVILFIAGMHGGELVYDFGVGVK